MVDNIDLKSLLNEKFALNKKEHNYRILYKKFKRRFPLDKTNELLDNINNVFIDTFVLTMKERHKEKYLENLYSNLSNCKIIKRKFIQDMFLDKEEFGGSFYFKRNIYLILGEKSILESQNASLTPYHELLHLMTIRITDKNTLKIGFQINYFAIGLNEGYTELLTKRYFGDQNDNDFEAYSHFNWLTGMLEEIIGRNKMEEFYFNSDLEGLILELEKYISREKVINLIKDIDLLFNSEIELFQYQKDFLYNNKYLDNEKASVFYQLNLDLRYKTYNTILEINNSKEHQKDKKMNFKLKNDKIKEKIDREEEVYRDYFRYQYKNIK